METLIEKTRTDSFRVLGCGQLGDLYRSLGQKFITRTSDAAEPGVILLLEWQRGREKSKLNKDWSCS